MRALAALIFLLSSTVALANEGPPDVVSPAYSGLLENGSIGPCMDGGMVQFLSCGEPANGYELVTVNGDFDQWTYSAQDYAANGGAETGNTSGWTYPGALPIVWAATAQNPHTGVYSIETKWDTGGGNGAVNLSTGPWPLYQTICAEGWAWLENPVSYFNLNINDGGGSPTIQITNPPIGSWFRVANCHFTTSQALHYIYLQGTSAVADNTQYTDDVVVRTVTAAGWAEFPGFDGIGYVQYLPDQNAIRLVKATTTQPGLIQTIEAGETFVAVVEIRELTSGGVRIRVGDSSTTFYSAGTQVFGPVPSGAGTEFRLECPNSTDAVVNSARLWKVVAP